MVLKSFFDFIQAPSMRISLILHLNFAHIKPQQPNPVILVTILAEKDRDQWRGSVTQATWGVGIWNY